MDYLKQDDIETEDEGFPPSERNIVTQSYDLSIKTLVEQWDDKTLIIPDIQREYVWDNSKASRLVESLILNIPVPVLYFSETSESRYEIIDGHQRVKSVIRYVQNEFALTGLKILSEYKGKRFHQLPEREQRHLTTRILRAVIISKSSHPNMKFEVFERLNTGSISLTSQELRNSMYRGSFNNLLNELVKTPNFRQIIGIKTPRKRMVDQELLLRFFALRSGIEEYRPPIKRFLNAYMDSVKNVDKEALDSLTSLFHETIDRIYYSLKGKAFRLLNPLGEVQDKGINRALFDSQMLAFSWLESDLQEIQSRQDAIVKSIAALNNDEGFLDAIRIATSDRTRTIRRVSGMIEALQNAGLTVSNVTTKIGE